MLLHFDEADDSTLPVDSSSYETSFTANSMVISGGKRASGYVTQSDAAHLEFGSDDFSIEFEITPSDVASGSQGILGKGTGTGGGVYGIGFFTSGGLYTFFRQDNSTLVDFGSAPGGVGTVLSNGTTTRCMIERAGDTFRMYMDGVMVAKTTSSSGFTVRSNTAAHRIGDFPDFNSPFLGTLEEVRYAIGEAYVNSDAGYTPVAVFPNG